QSTVIKENIAFITGEDLTYRIYFQSKITGKITAGKGYLKVENSDKKIKDKDLIKIVAYGKSKGPINWIIKVSEYFESYVDKKTLKPYYFIRKTREGNYKRDDNVVFDYNKKEARSSYDTTEITNNFNDFISAIYYTRNYNFDTANINDIFYINMYIDDTTFTSTIQYIGKQTIKSDFGTFKCIGLQPKVITGDVFQDSYPGTIWVSDDKNHLPILAETKLFMGSVKLELIDAKGIKNDQVSRIY
ncbi:MAG: DUF3108 domain-containing protein, partial [Bacteroidota bacterium]|nr:DUF3108 domain-containing protein [Bacteroidota bacterium]